MKLATFIAAAAAIAFLAFVIEAQDVAPAPPCTDEVRKKDCQLPNCRCSGPDIPGGLKANQTPQFVFLTFDDAISSSNYPFYKSFFNKDRKNPNGHPITGTFYITHEYTNYFKVHDLWKDGHEIALHSMSHTPYVSYWKNLSEAMWTKEVVEQREQMSNLAGIPLNEIKGFRSPFLQTAGDVTYKVLHEANFQYDISRPTVDFRKPGLWPYTNDFRSTQDCFIQPCSVGQYKGLWTVPMIAAIGDNMKPCNTFETCSPPPKTAMGTYDILMRNFVDHYKVNRAPFGIYIRAQWIFGAQGYAEVEQRRVGFEKFVDDLLGLGDVYFVSVTRGLEWVKSPKTIKETKNFDAFKVKEKVDNCPQAYRCRYTPSPEVQTEVERYLDSCVPCPKKYPWVGNHLGRS